MLRPIHNERFFKFFSQIEPIRLAQINLEILKVNRIVFKSCQVLFSYDNWATTIQRNETEQKIWTVTSWQVVKLWERNLKKSTVFVFISTPFLRRHPPTAATVLLKGEQYRYFPLYRVMTIKFISTENSRDL